MPTGRKRGKLGLEIPQAVGPVSGWWFPWQVRPKILAIDGRCQRKSAYARPTGKIKKAQRFKRRHERMYGHMCGGVPELNHAPHQVKPGENLTVDHIVPLAKGGGWDKSNLRVVYQKANARLNGLAFNGGSR